MQLRTTSFGQSKREPAGFLCYSADVCWVRGPSRLPAGVGDGTLKRKNQSFPPSKLDSFPMLVPAVQRAGPVRC